MDLLNEFKRDHKLSEAKKPEELAILSIAGQGSA